MQMTLDISEGYEHLLSALDEACRTRTRRAEVAMLGDRPRQWTLALGEHVGQDGVIHFGLGLDVRPDGSIVGMPDAAILWRGGHRMPDGRALERFTIQGVATTVEWHGQAASR